MATAASFLFGSASTDIGCGKGAGFPAVDVRGKTEVVQRWMSNGELEAMKKTGLFRGGRSGYHFVTDAASKDPRKAMRRLALPKMGDVLVDMKVPVGTFGRSRRVSPLELGGGRVLPGGGRERVAAGDVRVIEVVKEYRPPRQGAGGEP